MRSSKPDKNNPPQAPPVQGFGLDVGVFEAQQLYRSGESGRTIGFARAAGIRADSRSLVELDLISAMAMFDGGDIAKAIDQLVDVERRARQFDLELQFRSAGALFSRQSEFLTPNETLPILSRLRQVATQSADLRSLCGLHLAQSRIEACRGNHLNARTHLESARGFLLRSPASELSCALHLVDSSLEVLGGNIPRAAVAARVAYSEAAISGSRIQMAGAAGMLGLVALLLGDTNSGETALNQGLNLSSEVLYMRLGILDNLAQVALSRDDLDQCDRYIRECAAIIARQSVPCRSWYDLAHQVTRCAIAAHITDWESVLEIVDEAEPEAARRHLRALRSTLLCYSAQANARLGDHHRAEIGLGAAVKCCPRGAMDALISIEVSAAICASLRGERTKANVHFERALSGAKSSGNHLLQGQIDRHRSEHRRRFPGSSSASAARPGSETERALILADAASLLGGGTSVALLTQKAIALVGSAGLSERLETRESSGETFVPITRVSSGSSSDGIFELEIRGSDRRTTLRFRGVDSLEEVTLIRSLVDLLQAAVGQRSTAETIGDELLAGTTPPDDSACVFASARMSSVVREALRLAKSNLPILITGETGTGKDVLARLVHANSLVKSGPYVPFNCSSTPKDLLESQLFGHRRGSFTGAVEASLGVVRSATNGTLFLDEVGDLDIALQPKLLRFIESGEIHTVGDGRPVVVRVRIIAATNADLEAKAAAGEFRRDLFFRLGAAQINLPPLRERKDEIPALTASFVARYAREAGRPNLRVSDDLIAALLLYDWPGNIRQLANEMHRIVAMAEPGQTLTSADLSPIITDGWTLTPKGAADPIRHVHISLDQPLPQAIDALERQFIGRAMRTSGGRVAEAAQILGISRKGLFLKRRRWGQIDVEPAEPQTDTQTSHG